MAYWNLHERKLSVKGDNLYVNGEDLFFYHFSGYSPRRPNLISKYQTRFAFKDLPELKLLFDSYTELLYKNDYIINSKWPYGFSRFDNNARISNAARKAFYLNYGRRDFGNPFKTGKKNCFFNWWNSPWGRWSYWRSFLRKPHSLLLH